MNLLEQQLQSWTPRSPSDKISARLFAAPISAAGNFYSRGVNWLAPAAALAAMMLILFVTSPFRPMPAAEGKNFSFLPVFSSNGASVFWPRQSFALTKLDLNLEWNICSTATFEWTNRPGPASTIHSLTNHLIHKI
ncbi:MAG: hypothetical protein M3Y82_01445 [Verrucomicrobiota bacterium]|nr:hypothetical protein [Verrucomicrobiota bacterium]